MLEKIINLIAKIKHEIFKKIKTNRKIIQKKRTPHKVIK